MITILFWFFLVVFVLVCLLLCLLILIQSDKGGGISGAIGGGLGGASSLLGTQDTANILTRGTMIFGGAFMVLCVILSVLMTHQNVSVDKSALQKRAEKQQSYSPSSVLGNNQGLPLQGAPTPAPAAAGQQAVPAGENNTVPAGSIPLGAQPVESKK